MAKRVAIIGGGLAGGAAAYALMRAGHEVVIYEAGKALATGASGNSVGLYNPRFGAEWSPESRYFATGFARALEVFAGLDGVEFNPCGALHLITNERREKQFGKMVDAWGPDVSMRIVSKFEASKISGVAVEYDALYLPQSGSVHPAKLCAAYAKGADVRLGVRVDDLDAVDADVVILTAGAGVMGFDGLDGAELKAVRGQVTLLEANAQSSALDCHLCYDGYVSKAVNGKHMVGATFQRWFEHDDIMPEDDADNLERLYGAIAGFPNDCPVVGSWAGVRVASRDYFPLVGRLRDGVYVSTAHGSYGLLSSLMAGEILADMIDGKPQSVGDDIISALSPRRFAV